METVTVKQLTNNSDSVTANIKTADKVTFIF